MTLDNGPLLDAENNPLSIRQGDFIRRFNDLNRIMASMADFYEAGKTGDDTVIESLQQDFGSWVISSTRIAYEKESLEATITHYFGSKVIGPQETRLIIPHYNGAKLDDVLKDEHGLAYLQALFNTSDSAEEIKDTLQKLSGKSSSKIKVWTPSQSNRKDNPNRAAGLLYYSDVFLVNGNIDLDYVGRSRGVSESPAGAAPGNVPHETEHALPYELDSGINKKGSCVYFSNVQNVSDYSRYSAMVCFAGSRYVVSFTASDGNLEEWDKRVSSLMSESGSSKDKLAGLFDEFSPMYAHILKYQQESDGFVLVDDLEAFGEPRIKVDK